jgi:predicted metalloprotease with PDZ domain
MTYEMLVKTLEACSKTPLDNARTTCEEEVCVTSFAPTCEEEVHVISFAFYLKNVTQIYNIDPYQKQNIFIHSRSQNASGKWAHSWLGYQKGQYNKKKIIKDYFGFLLHLLLHDYNILVYDYN